MIFLGLAAALFAADYFIKKYMDAHFTQGTHKEVLSGKIILRNLHNPHGVLGLFKDREELGDALSFGALISVCWDFIRLLFSKGRRLEKLGVGMALGGGCSNLYEKKTKGYVTDYFSFGVKNERLKKIVFNLSDLFIFLGAFFYLAGQVLFLGMKERKR